MIISVRATDVNARAAQTLRRVTADDVVDPDTAAD
jgi:hypothetical protein